MLLKLININSFQKGNNNVIQNPTVLIDFEKWQAGNEYGCEIAQTIQSLSKTTKLEETVLDRSVKSLQGLGDSCQSSVLDLTLSTHMKTLCAVMFTCNPSSNREEETLRTDIWDLLANQTSLIGKFQANERFYLKGGGQWHLRPQGFPGIHTHVYTHAHTPTYNLHTFKNSAK